MSLSEVIKCSYFSISIFEGNILFVNFKVDLGSSDGQSTSCHHHRSDQLSWSTQNHRASGRMGRYSGSGMTSFKESGLRTKH